MVAEGAFVGQRVAGSYRVERTLGQGGMGHVWLARSEIDGAVVAVKKCVVPEGLSPYEQNLVRNWALQEARAAARVDHPNVIRILDVVADDEPWIVMEYVPSKSLLTLLEQEGPLPLARVAAVGLAVLNGLDAIHRAGVLHLDVKPGNVLVADDGRIVLTDFGPAVTPEGVAAFARAGIILGSPKYIAPERLFDDSTTAASDLWSLGATMYHAAEGRPPYLRPTTAETLLALDGSPPDRPRLAGPLQPLLDGLLARDPAARMAPDELADRLRRLAGGRPARKRPSILRPSLSVPPLTVPSFTVPSLTVPALSRIPASRRRVGLAAVAVLAIGALTAGVAAAGDGDRRQSVTPRAAASAPAAAASSPAPVSWPASAPVLPPVPATFAWWNDPSGYRVAVPIGWTRTVDAGAATFTAPAGQPVLRVGAWAPKPADVIGGLIARERGAKFPDYHRIRIEAQPDGAAVWEYTYTNSAGVPMRCLEQVATLSGQAYVLEWHTPRADWPGGLASLGIVQKSFGVQGP